MKEDTYRTIYDLVSAGNLPAAMNLLYDDNQSTIREPFTADLNHSWYLAGTIFFKDKKYRKAIEAFRSALAVWEEDSDAYLGLSDCYFELGDLGATRDILLEGSTRFPDDERIAYNLGNAYFDLAEFKKAALCYRSLSNSTDKELKKKAKRNLELAEQKLNEE